MTHDEISIFTAFGIRFWDTLYNIPVAGGLKVTARQFGSTNRSISARQTRSGNYAFFNLPGLHSFEYDHSSAAGIPVPKRKFLVKVEDSRNRFFPAVFLVDLPFDKKGLFPLLLEGSPVNPPDDFFASFARYPGFYLFSSALRDRSAGLAVLRAQLEDYLRSRPAAFALLEVTSAGNKWYGISDTRGSAAVYIPCPEFKALLSGSPQVVTGIDPGEQSWDISLRVLYSPGDLEYAPGENVPLMNSIFKQKTAVLWTELPASPPGPTPGAAVDFTLYYNKDLIIKTDGFSRMFIQEGNLS